MRKVFINRWFFLAVLVSVSLSAFSLMAYKKTTAVCSLAGECCRQSADAGPKNELLWDVISRQFTSFIALQ